MQVVGTRTQAANLSASTNATVTWRYYPPPAVQVYIFPNRTCPEGSSVRDCREFNRQCQDVSISAAQAAANGNALVRTIIMRA